MTKQKDTDSNADPRAVDVDMTKLRSRLANCSDFAIRTVRGLVYHTVSKSGDFFAF